MNWWHYLLLVNLYLVLFYAFYALLLRKETFFQLNRVYLVSAAILSFVIPMIQADWVQNLFITEQVRYTIYGGEAISFYAIRPIENTGITIGQALCYLYLAGIAFLSIRLVIQLIRLNQIINQPEPTTAYSFFKKISLGKNMAKEEAIVAHEQVHARQWHSVDVFIIEAVMIINWFNPVVYLYRYAIKHIHEFIADQQALKIGANKAEYALLLLSQTFNAPSHRLVNPFYNHSLLKKRIMMIQKNRSHRILLFKYVLSAPLFGLMLILSSATVNNSKAIQAINNHAGDLFVQPISESINEIDDNGKISAEELAAAGSSAVGIQPEMADTTKAIKNKVYESVEVEPTFPGGMNAFYVFLGKNVHYPAEARKNNIQGKVFIKFIVERNGNLSNIKALRGPGHGCDEEAVRAMQLSPKWTAGIQNGKKVRVEYTLPINFSLSKEDPTIPGRPPVKMSAFQAGVGRQLPNGVYESVENEPTFPGGIQNFFTFLSHAVRYPAKARENNIQGKVFVQFIVEKDGSLSDVISLRAPSPELGAEAVRAISLSPKWIAGIQNGKRVRVEYTMPVNFVLTADESQITTPKLKVTDVVLTPPAGANVEGHNKVYESVETEPNSPDFYNFLARTIKYPAEAREKKIQGKVFIQFVVEKDGSLSDVKALRGPGSGLNEEAVRAVSLAPKWNPGIQNGVPVRVQYTVPVNFTLSNADASLLTLKGLNNPLYIIDGVETTDLSTVDPKNIENVNILKDKAATSLYGEKAKNGVVIVTSKGKASGIKVNTADGVNPSTRFAFRNGHVNGNNFALIVLDGTIISGDNVRSINPDDIESIDVLNGEAAKKEYGEKAAAGVLIVKTKKAKK